MKKAISTARPPANRTAVMDMLAESPTGLEGLCRPLSPEQLHTAAAPGERSPVEVLAHLIHCEARASEAIYLALLEDQPLLPDIHPERQWGRLLRFDLLEFPDLLAYFRLRRLILLRVLAS